MVVTPQEQIKLLMARVVQRENEDTPQRCFADVVGALKRGASNRELRENYKIKRNRTMKKLRVMYAHYEHLKAEVDNLPRKGLRVLFDENVGTLRMMNAAQVIGDVSSVEFEAMASALDPQVWEYAVSHDIDLIVTRDKRDVDAGDLTYIAKQAWYNAREMNKKLPILMHVSDDIGTQAKAFSKRIQRHLPEIFAMHAAQVGPSILLSRRGVFVRISVEDAVESVRKRQMGQAVPVMRRREEVLARKYLQMHLNAVRKLDDDKDAVLRRIKREVTRKVAITARARATNDQIVRPLGASGRKAMQRLNQLANV